MRRITRLWMGSTLGLLAGPACAAWTVNMQPGVTETSRRVFALHMTIFWICVVIGVLVFSVMFWSMFRHRRSRGHRAARFHENTRVEILWTLIPLLIVIVMAVPATRAMVAMYDTADPELDVQITGHQWRWHYKYLNQNVEFFSNLATPREQIGNQQAKGEDYLLEVDQPLVLPAGAKVRLLFTGADVIHSWWVPALAVKKDAIPGFVNEAWTRVDRPGIYRGQCTELCGKDHGFMPVVVEVKSPDDFAAWLVAKQTESESLRTLASRDWTLEELAERGEKAYQTYCSSCHQAGGEGLPPTFPALKGSAIATGDVAAHLNIVVNGKPGTAMPAWGAQLSELDIAAIITYERNAWGNDTGDLVTPAQVLTFKQTQQ